MRSQPSSPLLSKRERWTSSDAHSPLFDTPGPDPSRFGEVPFDEHPASYSNMALVRPSTLSSSVQPPPLHVIPTVSLYQPNTAREEIEAESHAIRMRTVKKARSSTRTGVTYGGHLRRYITWYNQREDQKCAENPLRERESAEPITIGKATLFLDYEMTRPKRKRGRQEDEPGTTVGKGVIAQVINALESHRANTAYLYKYDLDAQQPLRRDPRIRDLERASHTNELKRTAESLAVKAAGTQSDTYTTPQLQDIALTVFTCTSTSDRDIRIGLRDRAMLLTSTASAFRGDNIRDLLWSDLFRRDVPLYQVRAGHTIPVLGYFTDHGKENQNGRKDETGTLRHRLVELCPVGALGLVMFAHFHIQPNGMPDFAPDFGEEVAGEYGRREWYEHHVFYASNPKKPMCYDNHRSRVLRLHELSDVSTTKVTHGGRHFAAGNIRIHGASVSDTKALGGWSESDAFKSCYDNALPVRAMIASAMFNSEQPQTYFVAREMINVPPALESLLFPWVELAESELHARVRVDRRAIDIALQQFLGVLRWLRRVLLQDMALLYVRFPDAGVFQYVPFNLPAFRTFAYAASKQVETAEEAARLAFENLPEHIINSVQGVMSGFDMTLQQDRSRNEERWMVVHEELKSMKSMVENLSTANTTKRRKTGSSASSSRSLSPNPVFPLPSTVPAQACPQAHLRHPPPPPSLLQPIIELEPSLSPPRPSVMIEPPLLQHKELQPAMAATATLSPPDTACWGLSSPASAASLMPPSTSPAMNALGHCPTPYVSTAPCTAPLHNNIMMPAVTSRLDLRTRKWQALAERHGDARLRSHISGWEWVKNDWLPIYRYQPVHTITDIWTEWVVGLGGNLPVCFLTEVWGASWRRNNPGLKTEGYRRMWVINLVNKLTEKPRWDVRIALQFIGESYETRNNPQGFTPRKFCDRLAANKGEGLVAILNASANYTVRRN